MKRVRLVVRIRDTIIQHLIVFFVFFKSPKIVVASSGRAGSTMLYDALTDSLLLSRFGVSQKYRVGRALKRYVAGHVYSLDKLNDSPFVICKTHDLQMNAPKGRYKYIFIYGDPLESALSVEKMVNKAGKLWFYEHQKHLRASGSYADLYDHDVLNYRNQLTGWLNSSRDDLLCMDYEDLWEKRNELSRFVGFEVDLPVRKQRDIKAKPDRINNKLFDELKKLKEILKENYESKI